MAPHPEGTSVDFITIMVTAEEHAEVVVAAMTHPGPDGAPKPLTVTDYLLMCHREHVARTKGS